MPMLDQNELLAFARRVTSEAESERYWSLKSDLLGLSKDMRDLIKRMERLEAAAVQNQWSTVLGNLWQNNWLKVILVIALYSGNAELMKFAVSLLK